MKTVLSLTAKIFACLFIAGLLGWGCASMSADENGDNDTSTKKENGESPDEIRIYNKWKLAGFVNGTDGTVKTPEPVSENTYWIIFNDNGTLSAKSSVNELVGEYKINFSTSTISITGLGGTKMGEYGDGKLFVESLWSIQFFIIEKNSLKLYYNEKDYLLFTMESPDEIRIYNKWKLAGFVNGTDETVKTPEPVSENTYWIIFNDNGTLSAKSSVNELVGEYKIDFSTSTISITKLGGTKMGEYGDGKLFVESLWSIQFFIIEKNSLKLYYNEKDYLLFNYIQP